MSASSFFLYTGTRRAFFQSVKVSPGYTQYENRPVKGETMAGSASFNNFGGMSSGPAGLFGLIVFSLRRTLHSWVRYFKCSLCLLALPKESLGYTTLLGAPPKVQPMFVSST